MTVGLPGAGIGGVFYLLSALAMPIHALAESAMVASGLRPRSWRRSPPWRLVWKQFAIAVTIIAGLWTTGWILAAILIAHPTALGAAQTSEIGRKLPNVLRAGAVLVSVGTLAIVLASVQIARLVVAASDRRREAKDSPILKIAAAVLFAFLAPAADAQDRDAVKHVTVADSAYEAGDTATARREYELAIASNPEASRALYRLGQLSRANPRVAEGFFRRYTKVEAGDAWGWTALGDMLSKQGKLPAALDAYRRASEIAPHERDVVIGRARVLAAAVRTDDAIAAYESWITRNASDAEAVQELAVQQRRAGRYREAARSFGVANDLDSSPRAQRGGSVSRSFAAPAVELLTGGSRDSEQNQSARAGVAASIQVGDRVRGVVAGGRRWLSGFSDVTVDDGSLGIAARPLAAFRLEVSGGISRPHSTITITDTIPVTDTPIGGNGNGRSNGRGRNNGTPPPGTIIQTESESSANVFTGALRGVLRKPGGQTSLDFRLTRTLLDATPVLVINRVVRSEAAARGDLEVFPKVKLRAGARAGSYNATGDDNTRVSLLGGIAIAALKGGEVSGVFQRLAFSRPTTSGYFAPKVAQLAEVGSYAEFESENGTVLAVDVGAGAQRLQEFEAAMGDWKPSFRLFASLDIPFRAASAIHFELDSYDSRLGSDAPSSASSWKSASLSASVRLALR